MADSLIFGSFDRPIQMAECCSVCKFPPAMDSPNSKKYIPLDLVYEMLTRTPCLRTLDSCKLICRDWNQLLHKPSFMPDYCRNTNNVCGFILQGNDRWNQEFVSLEDTEIDKLGRSTRGSPIFSIRDYDAKILASSNQAGILLAAGCNYWSKERQLYIGKPTLHNWIPLMNPDFYTYRTVTAAVVVLSSNTVTRYKIIRLSHQNLLKKSNIYHREVFDSRMWGWKTLKDVELGFEVYLDDSAGEPVTIGKLVHWLTTDSKVLAYNSEDDLYHQFSLPEFGKLHKHDWRMLVTYEGKLAIMCTNQEQEITKLWAWMGGVWRMVMEFKIAPSMKPVGMYNRDIVGLAAPEKIVFYNVRDSSIIRSVYTGGAEQKIFPFRSDCEEVDLWPQPQNVVATGWD